MIGFDSLNGFPAYSLQPVGEVHAAVEPNELPRLAPTAGTTNNWGYFPSNDTNDGCLPSGHHCTRPHAVFRSTRITVLVHGVLTLTNSSGAAHRPLTGRAP